MTSGVSARLPDFPWDHLVPAAKTAAAHPDGIVDLSVGTPVDDTPQVVQRALAEAANAPGYPTAHGSLRMRTAVTGWLARRHGVTGLDPTDVLATVGSKELLGWLPTMLGLGAGDTVLIPELAYPTYAVGALLVAATVLPSDATLAAGPGRVSLMYLNSPSNPTGRVLPVEHLAKVVAWARERGVLVVSDECYLELGWSTDPAERPVSVLHPDVCGGSHEGLLAVHSLSKRSNLAGYRAAFVAGDPVVVRELLALRKHLGMIVPAPVQAAMAAALDDDEHVTVQRAVYRARRELLAAALVDAGFEITHSQAGLYLWASRGELCWDTVAWLAERGILVAPGEFYGAAGAQHVRIALTATDERIAAGAARLRAS